MKINRIIYAAVAMTLAVACVQTPEVEFGVDASTIEIGPAGGVRKINVSSSGNWVVITDAPWISVSPANGRGTVECAVNVDSALVTDSRSAIVRIQNLETGDH